MSDRKRKQKDRNNEAAQDTGSGNPAAESGSKRLPDEKGGKESTSDAGKTPRETAAGADTKSEETEAEPSHRAIPRTERPVPLRERLRLRKRSIMRRIEYQRLRRIRKRTVPAYVHCKNCGEKLQGMYCHRCGQYALDIEQPFWKYIKQYFENVYQFDSKVWQTLYLLFRRPGLLTQEFTVGRINSYVHPLRLFMFLSALFFLFSFLFVPDSVDEAFGPVGKNNRLDKLKKPAILREVLLEIKDEPYSEVWMASAREELRGLERIVRIREIPGRDTLKVEVPDFLIEEGYLLALPQDTIYWSSSDPRLPKGASVRLDNVGQVKQMKRDLFYKQLVGWFARWLPVIVLLLIPIFALLLKAFFRKRRMRYMTHFVLALHLHAGLLILLTLLIVWVQWFGSPAAALKVLPCIFLLYVTVSLHRVYGNGWIKSIVKSVLLYGIYLILTSIILCAILAAVVVPLLEQGRWW